MMAWRSETSRSQIACNASAVALSSRLGGSASSHAAYWACSVDVLELDVSVRVAGAFPGLGICPQTEVQSLQQATDQLLAGDEAPLGQRRRQMALALADPQEGCLGITTDRQFQRIFQRFQ